MLTVLRILCETRLDHSTLHVYTRQHKNEDVFKEDQRNRTTFLQFNIHGTFFDERLVSRMTSITSLTLNVHFIENVIEFLDDDSMVQRLISNMFRSCVSAFGG